MTSPRHEVVISGIGGKFPDCYNVEEFKEKLFAKKQLLRKEPKDKNGDSVIAGRIPEFDKFDNMFFGIQSKLAQHSDPSKGLMLERAYESIVDAGLNLAAVAGRHVAVIAANNLREAEMMANVNPTTSSVVGMGMVGNSSSMMANRISYALDLKGPSCAIDAGWSSAMQGLQMAWEMISSGRCEAAIVSSCYVMALPTVAKEYMAVEGACKSSSNAKLDEFRFARSEAVVSFYLQRAEDAKRHYCTLLKADTRTLTDKPGSFINISQDHGDFLRKFYEDIGLSPRDVSYVENCGFPLYNYNLEELNTVADVLGGTKSSPLLVGSLFGNIGCSEGPSGLIQLTKAIIAMECGKIPPSINTQAAKHAELKVVTETTELPGDVVAVNSYNLFGTVGHAVVKRHSKTKKSLSLGEVAEDGLPRLLLLQARNEAGANSITSKLQSMAVDVEFVSMVNDVFKSPVSSYLWRAYTILPSPALKTNSKILKCRPDKFPVWFVFSGMGSQWEGMGEELLHIPVFAAAIDQCDKVLHPRGLDIRHIITSTDSSVLDNILNCFLGICAIQIGLVDVLHAVGVTADGIIGHSVGELGCAYADGCFTLEETILAAYARGKASLEAYQQTEQVKGMMAAVGLGYEDIKSRLPNSIDVACHNSATSCTLSGPTDDVNNFVAQLKAEGVFAKAVSAGGIAYHSRYIKSVAPIMMEYLNQSIKEPKTRSSRWVSSSVPEDQWLSPSARLCSAEYLTNNLLSPVLFDEACKHLPQDALLVEVAPHALLQAILKRSVNPNCVNIPLTNKNNLPNLDNIFSALGELYLHNVDVDANALYPPVQYPVARGTPSPSSLLTWHHEDNWYQHYKSLVLMFTDNKSFERSVDILNEDFWDRDELCVNGRRVIPFLHFLKYPWNMLLENRGLNLADTAISIENVNIYDDVIFDESASQITTCISPVSCEFAVMYKKSATSLQDIVTGEVHEAEVQSFELAAQDLDRSDMEEVTKEGLYHLFSRFGYLLGTHFQSIQQLLIGKKDSVARVKWQGNISAFLNALFDVVTFIHIDEKEVFLKPVSFKKLSINYALLADLPTDAEVEVHYDRRYNRLVCEAVELLGLQLGPVPVTTAGTLLWAEEQLQPYLGCILSLQNFFQCSLQLAADAGLGTWGNSSIQLNIIVLKNELQSLASLTPLIRDLQRSCSSFRVNLIEADLEAAKKQLSQDCRQSYLVVGEYNALEQVMESGPSNGFLYCLTYLTDNGNPTCVPSLRPILTYQNQDRKLALLKKVVRLSSIKCLEAHDEGWLTNLRLLASLESVEDLLLVVTTTYTPRHLLPILAKEPYAHRVRTYFIQDKDAPKFSARSIMYSSQIALGLPVNILRNGAWCSLRTIDSDIKPLRLNINNVTKLPTDEICVDIHCLGLNLLNAMHGNGENIKELDLRIVDYSGRVDDLRVMGVAVYDAATHRVSADPILSWTLPGDWSMEAAATVPAVYALAYYCVHMKAELRPGESILVNAGLSPLGLAVITFALAAEATVFTSVFNDQDVKTMLNKFPKLKSNQVISLESENIGVVVRSVTKGKGVGVIINCLDGRHLLSSTKAMGFNCRFLHLCDVQQQNKEYIGLSTLFRMTSIHGVSFRNLFDLEIENKTLIQQAIKKGISQGLIVPFKQLKVDAKDETSALRKLKLNEGKTVMVRKTEGQKLIVPIENFQFNDDQIVIISGTMSGVWLDVAEWLFHRGARKLVILLQEDYSMGLDVRRFNKLVNNKKCRLFLTTCAKLDSYEDALLFFDEVLRVGTIRSLFCIGMTETGERMRNLEAAAAEKVPYLEHFVSLLCKGTAASETRALRGLPVCCLQSHSSISCPDKLLPYLTRVLSGSKKSIFLTVSDNIKTEDSIEKMEYLPYLPDSLEKLHDLGERVSDTVKFLEQKTLSPGLRYARHNLLPIFVIPGLDGQQLEPLFRKLLNPTFCTTVPAHVSSVHNFAELLLQKVLVIQPQGPYNLVGDSWSGAVAMELAIQLEARGHTCHLFLIDGTPLTTSARVRALCQHYHADLGTSVLAASLALPSEVSNSLNQQTCWEKKLATVLDTSVPESMRAAVGKALNLVYHQLSAVEQYTSDVTVFKGNLTVITSRSTELPVKEVKQLMKLCRTRPKIFTTDDCNYEQLLRHSKTASVINSESAFCWDC